LCETTFGCFFGGVSFVTLTGAVSLAVTFGPVGGVPVAVATLSYAACTFGREQE
jgi:hypothetical protein